MDFNPEWLPSARRGDDSSKQQIVDCFTPTLVKPYAAKWAGLTCAPVEDLESAGVFGLLVAVKKSDPQNDSRFPGYAKRWVQGEITGAAFNHLGMTPSQRKLYHIVFKYEELLKEQCGGEPTCEEIAEAIPNKKLQASHVKAIKDMFSKPVSLESVVEVILPFDIADHLMEAEKTADTLGSLVAACNGVIDNMIAFDIKQCKKPVSILKRHSKLKNYSAEQLESLMTRRLAEIETRFYEQMRQRGWYGGNAL